MKSAFWILSAVLMGGTSNAQSSTSASIILRCRNAAQNLSLSISEAGNHRTYAIILADFYEQKMLSTSYVLKSENVTANPEQKLFSVESINGTDSSYTLSIEDSHATLRGKGAAKHRLFAALFGSIFPSRRFNSNLFECAP